MPNIKNITFWSFDSAPDGCALRKMMLRRIPISFFVDPKIRAIFSFTTVLDTNTIRAVLISLVLLVEDLMKEELEGNK